MTLALVPMKQHAPAPQAAEIDKADIRVGSDSDPERGKTNAIANSGTCQGGNTATRPDCAKSWVRGARALSI